MGMSVDIHAYDVEKLKAADDKGFTAKEDQLKPSAFLEKLMPVAGAVYNGVFVMQSCDYWEDYNPWSNMLQVFERYYQSSNGYDVFDEAQVANIYNGIEEYELWDAAGIDEATVPSHPDDEE